MRQLLWNTVETVVNSTGGIIDTVSATSAKLVASASQLSHSAVASIYNHYQQTQTSARDLWEVLTLNPYWHDLSTSEQWRIRAAMLMNLLLTTARGALPFVSGAYFQTAMRGTSIEFPPTTRVNITLNSTRLLSLWTMLTLITYIHGYILDLLLAGVGDALTRKEIKKLSLLSYTTPPYESQAQTAIQPYCDKLPRSYERALNTLANLQPQLLNLLVGGVLSAFYALGPTTGSMIFPLIIVSWLLNQLVLKLANSQHYRDKSDFEARKAGWHVGAMPYHGMLARIYNQAEYHASALTSAFQGYQTSKRDLTFRELFLLIQNSLIFLACIAYANHNDNLIRGNEAAKILSLFSVVIWTVTSNRTTTFSMASAIESQRTIKAARKLIKSLTSSQQRLMNDDPKLDNKAPIVLRFAGVSFVYPKSPKVILHDASWTLKRGECAILIAPSGTGKTTILSLILNQVLPHAGEIFLLNSPNSINAISETLRSRHMSVAPQCPELIQQQSILYNILYGASNKELLHQIEACHNTVAQGHLIENIRNTYTGTYAGFTATNLYDLTCEILIEFGFEPDALTTLLFRRLDPTTSLSGGEKLRTSIARTIVHAVVNHTSLLLLDEITEHLDVDTASGVLACIARVSTALNAAVVFTSTKEENPLVLKHFPHMQSWQLQAGALRIRESGIPVIAAANDADAITATGSYGAPRASM